MLALYVAAGSALGGVCRHLVTAALNAPAGFPWGTLAVNVAGALALGALSGWLAHATGNAAAIRAFAVVGVCGGFTTFSTFSGEMFAMAEGGRWGMLLGYMAATLLAGFAAVWLGHALSR